MILIQGAKPKEKRQNNQMDKVCRLCLNLQANMTSIFCGDKGSTDLQLKIQNFCAIEVSADDVLPKMICQICKQKLSSIEEFMEQCKHSDLKLREHFKIPMLTQMHQSLLKDVGIQKGDETEESSRFPKQSVPVNENKDLWKELGPDKVPTDEATVQSRKSDSSMNGTYLTDNYDSDNCRVKKYNSNPRSGLKVQHKSNVTLAKKRTKLIKQKEQFLCNFCQKIYISKKALLKHTEGHVNKEIVTCKVCNKAFNHVDKLDEHLKKHGEGMNFKCEVCGMPFKEQAKLNFHLRVHGKGPPINTDKQYLCDICSRTFVSKSGLRFHLKSHAGTKPYECKYCNKCFTIPSYKKRHERTHTGDKHYMCHICSAGFASANGLKYHLRSHTGEANYHCDTCGKSFKRLKYLKEHTFTHTGERPFICKICGSAYGNSGSLFAHVKKCKSKYVLGDIAASQIQAAV